MVPKTRLGKRSPLGTLVCGSSAEGLTETGPLGCPDSGPHRSKLYPGQKVSVVHKVNNATMLSHFMVFYLIRFRCMCTVEAKNVEVWSNSITTWTMRNTETVDMDEIMAAMVLTSLSCSPVIQHSAPKSLTTAYTVFIENGGGELYDGGYWSCDHGNGSPAPSPPITEMDKSAPLVDEGLDMELDQMLFNEPTPRKRKNSVKVAYRCLWPNCGKILTTVVGIKRHIRNSHLGQSDEHSQREEDFYYTEVYQDLEQTTPSGGHRSSCTSPSSPSRHTTPSPTTPEMHQHSPLSQSAPGSFWQVHSEHSYQAPPPVQVVTPIKPLSVPVSCHWTPSLTVHQSKQGSPFRRRSVSVGEQWLQNNNATFRPHPASVSPPRNHCTSRRIRGEAKKCRKVYGIEHRDQWCTACRWKKACQRFLD
uniref:Zinc finger protein 395a n=1 Tax=Cyprinus carpio TaxID=7962 RepID=A0A8C1JLC3_CYPCA